jgi:hypothetical protein
MTRRQNVPKGLKGNFTSPVERDLELAQAAKQVRKVIKPGNGRLAFAAKSSGVPGGVKRFPLMRVRK